MKNKELLIVLAITLVTITNVFLDLNVYGNLTVIALCLVLIMQILRRK